MAPKAKANKAEKGPTIDDSTVQMYADNAGRDHLLPYLAQGFSPVYTSGVKAQCGVHALYLSWQSASLEAGWQDLPEYKAFLKLLKGARYQELCDEDMKKLYPKGRPTSGEDDMNDYDEVDDETRTMEWLHPEGLARLLHVANETYGTEYELGYVTEGFHGRYDDDGVWDAEWDYPTEVNTALIPEDKLNRPVIFVWNNNTESKGKAHNSKKFAAAHWEGFVAPAEKGDTAATADRRQRVQEWNMGGEMARDLARGVWIVDEDFEGIGENDLNIRAGHFLRTAVPPKNLKVPKGWRYMRLCTPNIDPDRIKMKLEGLIRARHLIKLERHEKAPSEGPPNTMKPRRDNDAGIKTEEQNTKFREENMKTFMELTGQSQEVALEWTSYFPDNSAEGLIQRYYDYVAEFEGLAPKSRILKIFKVRTNATGEQAEQFINHYGDLNTAVTKFTENNGVIELDEKAKRIKDVADFMKQAIPPTTEEVAKKFLDAYGNVADAIAQYLIDPKFFTQDIDIKLEEIPEERLKAFMHATGEIDEEAAATFLRYFNGRDEAAIEVYNIKPSGHNFVSFMSLQEDEKIRDVFEFQVRTGVNNEAKIKYYLDEFGQKGNGIEDAIIGFKTQPGAYKKYEERGETEEDDEETLQRNISEVVKALQQCIEERKKWNEDEGPKTLWGKLENALAKEIKLLQRLGVCIAERKTADTKLAELKTAEKAAQEEIDRKQTRIDELELLHETQAAGLSEAEVQAIRKEYEDAKAAALRERKEAEKEALRKAKEEKEAEREQYEASGEVQRIRDGIQPMQYRFDDQYGDLANEVSSLRVQLAECEETLEKEEEEEVFVKGLANKKRKRENVAANAGRKHFKQFV